MSEQMCEIKDQDLNKIRFYHMEGCYHCTTAKEFLQTEIDSNQIILLPSYCAEGVQGFPHFVNPKNGKTLTGCPKSKEDLFERLDYKENFTPLTPCQIQCRSNNRNNIPWGLNNGFYEEEARIRNYCNSICQPLTPEQKAALELGNCCAQKARYDKDNYFSQNPAITFDSLKAECILNKCKPPTPAPPTPAPPTPTKEQCCAQKAYKWCGNKICRTYNSYYNNCVTNPGQWSCPSSENYEPESMPYYPVVEHMETVSTDVLYRHHTGGYSKLSNCWVKQPNYTA